ncbi:pirin family protein, partial [Candidatus Hakubella thermalkaliphila]
MDTVRRVSQILKSHPTLEGAGVHLKRAFGFQQMPRLDPFLLLDDFHSDKPEEYLPGFPWHPHRGIETITYVLQGQVAHGDSLGNQGVITAGDVQWMTVGSGIIHQEMPRGRADGLLWGFQLWANLPARHKMMKPRYRGITDEQIPTIRLENGVVIRLICGTLEGVHGPVQDIVIDPEYLDVSLPAGVTFTHHVQAGYTVFAYVIEHRMFSFISMNWKGEPLINYET